MRNKKTLKLVQASLIAAVYTALTIAMGSLGFGFNTGIGFIQLRVAEALTLLPIFSPVAIVGVTLGCALSNALGFAMGLNILGAYDMIFGTIATLIAALLTYAWRNVRFKRIPVLSAIPPIIVNAIIIGLELNIMISGTFVLEVFLINALNVFVGQVIACIGIGLPFVYMLEKTGVDKKLFS